MDNLEHQDKLAKDNCTFLLLDDDDVFRERLAKALTGRGYKNVQAACISEALELTKQATPSHAVIDLCIEKESGLDAIVKLKELHPHLKMVVLTGFGSVDTAVKAMQLGADNFISKPATTEQILSAFLKVDEQEGPTDKTTSIPELAQVEEEHISRVLHQFGGNISQAAKALGIHRRSLQRRLAKK